MPTNREGRVTRLGPRIIRLGRKMNNHEFKRGAQHWVGFLREGGLGDKAPSWKYRQLNLRKVGLKSRNVVYFLPLFKVWCVGNC